MASLVGVLLCGCTVESPNGGVDKAGGAVPPAPLKLRLANTSGYEADPFIDGLAKASNGALTLTESQSGQLDGSVALGQARAGQVDIAIVPTWAFNAAGVTTFDALMDPMLVDSLALQDMVFADPVASDMLHGLASSGLVGVGVLPGPVRVPNGISRRMLGPATYVGARIATSASPISERALRALGAVPVESAFEGADITGFDGLDQAASRVAAKQYDKTVRWITTNVGLWPRPLAIVAGADAWGGLTDTQRGWLVHAAEGARSDPTNRRDDVQEVTNMCRRGRVAMVSASADEIGQLRLAFAPVDRWLRSDVATAGYIDRIQTIKRQLGEAPSGTTFDCAGLAVQPRTTQPADPNSSTPLPSPVPPGPASTVDGNYAMTTTAGELAAAGASAHEVNSANWGDLRWTLDRGRFASTQVSTTTSTSTTCTWLYGTYAIYDGLILELTVLDGGGDENANRPGEVFDYGLSTYRDTMTWSKVARAVSPTPWTVKPWQRQPTQPWPQFLQQDCLPPAQWAG